MTTYRLMICAFLLIVCVSARPPAIEEEAAKSIIDGNNEFAFDLYQELSAKPGNIFYSPFSISTALAMTYAGAAGETEKQMGKTLHFGANTESFHKAYNTYLNHVEGNFGKGVQLDIANKLWAQDGLKFKTEFIKTTKEQYGAGVELLDFYRAPEKSRKKINKWVESKTNEKIKELLKPGIVNSDTRLVLTNAIYFKGTWESEFDKALTKDGDFTLKNKKKVSIAFMNQKFKLGYHESPSFTAVRIPYKDNTHSMIMVLPRTHTGLAGVEKELNNKTYSELVNAFREVSLTLIIPKFKTTLELSLNYILKALGMPIAFSDSANFSKMAGGLVISDVVHKAFVEVNEEGTEAAAATAVVMGTRSMPKEYYFKADHPFIFMIVDNATNSILFMGRIEDPS